MNLDKFFDENNFDDIENKLQEQQEERLKKEQEEALELENGADECEGGACKI